MCVCVCVCVCVCMNVKFTKECVIRTEKHVLKIA